MLKLRPYKSSDAELIVNWIEDEKAFRLWCADRFEKYPLLPKDFDKLYQNRNDDFFGMIAEDEDDIIGHFFIQRLQQDKYKFGLIIVDNTKRGKGYGKRMLLEALNYAKTNLKATTVTLSVFDINESAYKCYLNLGFKETGTYVTHNLFGKEHNYIELEYLL
ncbi:MAG: GNAT family N-acetyltransferase [Clostridia bacterium]|nr:GNAT family N-acetyltransferase [Clostridia bacterium]